MPSVSRWLVLSLLALCTLPACLALPPEQGTEVAADAPAPEQEDVAQVLPESSALATTSCLAKPLLSALGKSHVLVGGKMSDDVASQAPFDVRYMYLAGGLFDSVEPCGSCLSCTAQWRSCSNASGGCGWWGCWQWDQQAPGQYLRDFLRAAALRRQIPMITYYELLHTSGVADGTAEVLRVADVSLMRRYFNDWRFVLKQIGSSTALLHIEPDFWAYAQFLTLDPRLQPAAVASANPTDCANQPNSVAGMGHCLISMVRKYAPNAKVGLHASAWATKLDVHLNTNPLLNVTAEANKVADFLRLCGAANGDFIVVEASDRDAQWYQVTTGTNCAGGTRPTPPGPASTRPSRGPRRSRSGSASPTSGGSSPWATWPSPVPGRSGATTGWITSSTTRTRSPPLTGSAWSSAPAPMGRPIPPPTVATSCGARRRTSPRADGPRAPLG